MRQKRNFYSSKFAVGSSNVPLEMNPTYTSEFYFPFRTRLQNASNLCARFDGFHAVKMCPFQIGKQSNINYFFLVYSLYSL